MTIFQWEGIGFVVSQNYKFQLMPVLLFVPDVSDEYCISCLFFLQLFLVFEYFYGIYGHVFVE